MRARELPSTLQRSPKKAQETFRKTHDHAVEEYGEGERAHRTAFAALKRGFEKKGDHWEQKDEPGPSDPRSTKSTAENRQELYARAKKAGIEGRSRMSKAELARALARKE